MVQGNFIVRCPRCKAKNRIPATRAGDRGSCGKCRSPLPFPAVFPENPVELSDRTFQTEIAGFQGPAVALFWAPWCGHCARLMPIFDELANEFAGSVKFGKVELEKNPVTASQHQVQSVPVMVLFKNGRIVNKLLGALPKYQIEHHLRSLI